MSRGKMVLSVLAVIGATMIAGSAMADETVRGRDLMTPQEQSEMRDAMRNAKTPEEREKIRGEQRAKLEQRAAEQGKTLQHQGPGGQRPGPGFGAGNSAGSKSGQP